MVSSIAPSTAGTALTRKASLPGEGVSIVVPAYNEEQAIGSVLTQMKRVMDASGLGYEIIVVDDGSSDGTARVATGHDGVTVLRHPSNRGYGAALKTGIRHAWFDLICITDADGTYPNERIPDLVQQMEGCDMVVGARTGPNVAVPMIRRPAKWLLNRLADYLAQSDIPDLNSGLRVFRKDVALEFWRVLPRGFSFTTTITLALLTNDYIIKFVPIDYHPRTGRSKIRPVQDTLNFTSLIVRTVLYFAPLRVFIPLSLGLLLLGIISLIYRTVAGGGLAVTTMVIFLAALQMAAVGLLADMIDKRSPRADR